MLAPPMTVAAPAIIQLRQAGPEIAPARARTMTPAELGDAVLAAPHPPVVDAGVGPEGMGPPPPPNTPVPTELRLYLRAEPGPQAGFCQRTIATVTLRPVDPAPDGSLPASPPATIALVTAYHWAGTGVGGHACPASRYAFFIPRSGELTQTFGIVRLVAAAQRAAKRGGPLPFALSVEDEEGPAQLAFDRAHPELGPTPHWQVFTDPRRALAALPLGTISYVGPWSSASPATLLWSDLQDLPGRLATGTTLFLGGDWTAGIVVRAGSIIRIRLRRAIPPPF